MCDHRSGSDIMWRYLAAAAERDAAKKELSPEGQLSEMLSADLGVDINPQALRMFIRARWSRASKLAHSIHESA